jgi:hypothetical protein
MMVSNLNYKRSGIETQEDARSLPATASRHIERPRTSLESAVGSVPAYGQTLLLKVASRSTPLADAMQQLAAAIAQGSI